jgi:hypothetical protein
MGIETGTALLISGLIGGGTAAASSILGSRAAGKAAETQATAAENSSDAILQAAREGNLLQALQYFQGQQNLAPWQEVGGEALMTLKDLLQPEGYLAQGFPEFKGEFNAPELPADMTVPEFNAKFNFDDTQVQKDPGWEFRLNEGMKAIERSAAARGGAMSGSAVKAAQRFAGDLASEEYGKAYERQYGQAKDTYNREMEDWLRRYGVEADKFGRGLEKYGLQYGAETDKYGRKLGEFGTNFSVDQANKGNLFNRLSMLAGTGQTATGQGLNLGSNFATSTSGNTMAGARGAADAAESAAAARASGYIGRANAYDRGLGAFSQIPQYLTLASIFKRQQ